MILKASGTIHADQLPVAERLTESGRMSASGPRGEKLFPSPLRLITGIIITQSISGEFVLAAVCLPAVGFTSS